VRESDDEKGYRWRLELGSEGSQTKIKANTHDIDLRVVSKPSFERPAIIRVLDTILLTARTRRPCEREEGTDTKHVDNQRDRARFSRMHGSYRFKRVHFPRVFEQLQLHRHLPDRREEHLPQPFRVYVTNVHERSRAWT
jgi:hypothetical protein